MSKMNKGVRIRLRIAMVVCFVLISLLVIRLAYIQIKKSEYYSNKAYEQQVDTKVIKPKRGTIYDATGTKILAQSLPTHNLVADPTLVKEKEEVAQNLANIVGLGKEEVLEDLNKSGRYALIMRKIDDEVTEKVREYVSENSVDGIYLVEDSYRTYPYGTLMAHTLGFVGIDGNGLSGIEAYYEKELAGNSGKVVAGFDTDGREIPYSQEQYIAAEDGKDLVLTIDATVQSIVEKYLSKAVTENIAQYGSIVVMRPQTGEVLAIANYPTFNLNTPFTPYDEEVKKVWDTYDEKTQSEYLNQMWRNRAISDSQEPGSTFKVVTATAALEENIVNLDDKLFNCAGSYTVSDWNIKCWRYYNPHGQESLREGIMNSCNPVFMQLSQRMGISKFMKYIHAFNLDDKTGIDLPGEATGIMHNANTMTNLDLATSSFGQTIQITTLQTAVNYCAVANGGYLVKPYVVKEIKNSDGNFDEQISSKVVKQIMSEQTSQEIMSALVDTVNIGTGRPAKIRDYQIAGKTATGENGRGDNLKYLVGFVGVAPASSPEVVVAVNLFDPKGPLGNSSASICCPIVSGVIDETLKYMDVKPDYALTQTESNEKVVPNLIGKTYKEARELVADNEFNILTSSEYTDDTVITNQVPRSGAGLLPGSNIMTYKENDEIQKVTVPDVRNMSKENAIATFKEAGLNVHVEGEGFVLNQDVGFGTQIDRGSIVTIKCIEDLNELP